MFKTAKTNNTQSTQRERLPRIYPQYSATFFRAPSITNNTIVQDIVRIGDTKPSKRERLPRIYPENQTEKFRDVRIIKDAGDQSVEPRVYTIGFDFR